MIAFVEETQAQALWRRLVREPLQNVVAGVLDWIDRNLEWWS
jgi:hypothetical protein